MAKLIQICELIIQNEVTISHRRTLDRTLPDLKDKKK